jgi:hypothetical protein
LHTDGGRATDVPEVDVVADDDTAWLELEFAPA